MFDVRELTKPRPGFLYEPRVLWGMGYITKVDQGNGSFYPQVQVVLPGRDSYYNGSRWPIVLTDVITLVQSPAGFPYLGDGLIGQIPIELSALGGARYSLGQVRGLVQPKASTESLEAVDPVNYDPVPTENLIVGTGTQDLPVSRLRSVQNLARWDFDHTLMLPPAAYLELQLSGRVPTFTPTSDVPVKADVNFYSTAPDEGAQWPGSTMTRTGFAIGQLNIPTAQFYYQALQADGVNGEGDPVPFNTLPFQGFAGGPLSQLYPPGQVFTSRQAVQQKATFNLPTRLHGFSVGFDQNALDVALAPNIAGPLSTTTYVRARSRNGGTQNFWWRDGAPLAICTPSMTPATVSKLHRPLAVQPGEGFKLTLPSSFKVDDIVLPYAGRNDDEVRFSQGVFYISFCGYAVVEA